MTGNAIKSEALELRKLSSEELDAVSGGFFSIGLYALGNNQELRGENFGDAAQMFQQVLQQLTQEGM